LTTTKRPKMPMRLLKSLMMFFDVLSLGKAFGLLLTGSEPPLPLFDRMLVAEDAEVWFFNIPLHAISLESAPAVSMPSLQASTSAQVSSTKLPRRSTTQTTTQALVVPGLSMPTTIRTDSSETLPCNLSQLKSPLLPNHACRKL
jgi:hypothetical protein